ncbi:hypothetical protein CROQUDRAFT_96071, partial [Cronartium quercuum f. sp. fusiforme G11]
MDVAATPRFGIVFCHGKNEQRPRGRTYAFLGIHREFKGVVAMLGDFRTISTAFFVGLGCGVSSTKVVISSRLGVRAQVYLRKRSDWNKAPAHPFTHHSPSKLLGTHFDPSDPKLTFDRIGLQPASPPPPVHSGQTCLVIAHPASHPIPSTPRFPSIPLDFPRSSS